MSGGFCPGGFVRGVLSWRVLSWGVLSGGVLSRGVLSPGGFGRGVLSGGVLSRILQTAIYLLQCFCTQLYTFFQHKILVIKCRHLSNIIGITV